MKKTALFIPFAAILLGAGCAQTDPPAISPATLSSIDTFVEPTFSPFPSSAFDEMPNIIFLEIFNAEGQMIKHEATKHLAVEGCLIYVISGYEIHETSQEFRISSRNSNYIGCELTIKKTEGSDCADALDAELSELEKKGRIVYKNDELYNATDRVLPVSAYNEREIMRHEGEYDGSTVLHDGFFTYFADEEDKHYFHLFSLQKGNDAILIMVTQEISETDTGSFSIMPELYAMLHTVDFP